MTKKVAFFADNGFEEIELIAPLDILRRAEIKVDLISANNNEIITGAHNISLVTNKLIKDVNNILEYDAIVIPGGMPGSTLLKDNEQIIKFYKTMYENNKLVAAICAAPIVLNEANILKDKVITCYPSFEQQITCKQYDSKKAVVIDNNVITAQGPAVAYLFGLELVEYLVGKEIRNNLSNAMLTNTLKENI